MNTKKFIRFVFLFAIVALIVGFSACERVSQIIEPATPQMTEVGEEISIGVVLPFTGRFRDTSGSPLLQSFELALSEINAAQPHGADLKLIIADDQSTIEGAVAAFNKLIPPRWGVCYSWTCYFNSNEGGFFRSHKKMRWSH